MTNNEGGQKAFDLEERTGKFGAEIVKFAKTIPVSPVSTSLISQLVRAGTSVGANYCEANNALSRKDFLLKIGISKKESRETLHWLRMVVAAFPELRETASKHWKEAHELNLIFAAIVNKTRQNANQL